MDIEKKIGRYPLCNSLGMEVEVTNYGGRIVSIKVYDNQNIKRDVVLGFDDVLSYRKEVHLTDFGATIGRYANRIGNGVLKIDGQSIQLPQNNFTHCLHGGPDGFQYQVFDVIERSSNKIKMRYVDPAGHNNFPGTLTFEVTFEVTEINELRISYYAVTDATTVINITNHSYFNLNGDPSQLITNHLIEVDASRYTPINSTFLPTGEMLDVEGSIFDLRKPHKVGEIIDRADITQIALAHGLDHNFVLSSSHAARIESPLTGICMDVFTSEPGLQIYSGNFLDGSIIGKGGKAYKKHSAICLETQKFPDSPNHPEWQNTSNPYLHSGEEYSGYCNYCFSIKKP